MTLFQQLALVLIAIWLALVAVRFRRSRIVLTGGLVAVGILTLACFLVGRVSLKELGLATASWPKTLGFALAWLGLMLAASPLADRLASLVIDKPPTLGAFRALQESRAKLVAGIALAWLFGGFLEELTFRGLVLSAIEAWLKGSLPAAVASGSAIVAASAGAAVIHLYQGPKAALIIAQLSMLFGALFVVSGHDLLSVILCHGLYDTVAFIRFANRKSRYANLDRRSGT